MATQHITTSRVNGPFRDRNKTFLNPHKKKKLSEYNIERIAIFRALQLGDLLCTVPVFRAIRRAFPGAEITLIGLPWARAFAKRFSRYFDCFLPFPGHPALPEIPPPNQAAIYSFFAEAQQYHFDLAIQVHGDGMITNTIVRRLGAAISVGFYKADKPCPDAKYFLPYPEHGNEIYRNLSLIDFLGLEICGDELEFPVNEEDYGDLKKVPDVCSLDTHNYICIHPGSRLFSRRWPIQRFAEVANTLSKHGYQIVITGSSDEVSLANALQEQTNPRVLNLAGKTSLGGVAALLSKAKLLVSNDTGVSHIAAGLRVPSVIVCSGADPQRWAPLNHHLHHVVYHAIDCRPCAHFSCPIGHPCALNVQTKEVIEAALRLLAQQRSASPGVNTRPSHFSAAALL